MFHAKKAAESLIESLLAVTVIVIATTAAVGLVNTSLRGNEVIGEKVVALNLALEGVEAVKNMRDTNYLLYASDANTCWDKFDVTDVSECVSADILDESELYYLDRNTDTSSLFFQWDLLVAGDPSTEGFLSLYNYQVDMDGDGSPEDVPLYLPAGLELSDPSSFVLVEEDAYQRHLAVSYIDSDSFDLTVTVYWDHRGQQQSLSLTRTIVDVY